MNATTERFDLNSVSVQSEVRQIRPFATSLILIHLNQPRASVALDSESNLLEDVSLAAGDGLAVSGWLKDVAYDEGLENFLARAGHLHLLEEYPSLAALRKKTCRRSMTAIIPDGSIDVVPEETEDVNNLARIEGVVVRIWGYSTHKFVRLAVYDRHEKDLDEQQPEGELPRRKAHYVTVQFTDGLVDGRKIHLKPKNRVRVSGRLTVRGHVETLREWLRHAKLADFIHTFENPDLLDQVKARYGHIAVEACKIIVFN